MDFWTSLQVIGRRWRVFVPALVISALVTLAVVHEVKPSYQASSTVLIVPPKISTTTNPLASSNAFLQFPNYNTVAALLATAETAPTAKAQLATKGVTASYTASPDPAGQVPEVNLNVTGKDPSVLQQSQTLTQDVSSRLVQLQARTGAPPVTYVTASVLSPPTLKTVNSSRIRVAGALGAILLFLSIALAFAAESLAKRRSTSAAAPGLPATTEAPPSDIDMSPAGRVSFRLRTAQPPRLDRPVPEVRPSEPQQLSTAEGNGSNGLSDKSREIVHPLESRSESTANEAQSRSMQSRSRSSASPERAGDGS
jgi:capsular polysaccharide biosynthesis protein